MKPFLENSNLEELEAIQEYMDDHHIGDPDKLTEADYEIIEESVKKKSEKGASLVTNSIFHLLKYKYQPEKQKEDWLDSIKNGCIVIPNLSTNQYKRISDDMEEFYKDIVTNDKIYDETKGHIKRGSLPESLKDALGTDNLNDFSDWNYIKDNIIEPYALDKDRMNMLWDRKKWDNSNKNYKTGNKYKNKKGN